MLCRHYNLEREAQKICSLCLFVTENTSLFMFNQSHARNDALKSSLDTVKLQQNCMISSSGGGDLEAPEGSVSPPWILKVITLSLSRLPLIRHWEKNRSWWPMENIVFHLRASVVHFHCCPWKCVERQPTAWQKHTRRSCWCPWCLSICRPEIMAFTAQLVLTSLPIFWTDTQPPAVLCVILSW